MADIGSYKKHKSNQSNVTGSVRASKLFSPFRIIGNVTNEVPFAVGTLGSTFYVATSVGKCFQIYDASNLHLLFVAEKEVESKISCLAAHFHHLYVGYGSKVGVYKRGRQEHLIELPEESEGGGDVKVCTIRIFGDFLCVSASNNTVYVFKKAASDDKVPTQFYTKFTINKLQGGEIVSLIHLPTYLNKLVVVTKSNLLLYNVRSRKLLFTSDEFSVQISTAEPAPALDILALGSISGEVLLFNMKKGRIMRSIKLLVPVSSISFRTDGSAHISVGSSNGDLIFYDLNRFTRIHILKGIHKEGEGGVVKACFLNGQPIVVTSGGDNQLKEFAFDPSLSQSDGETVVQPPRLLRSRGGHSQPPSCIMFADKQSHFLLSASKDRSLWGFSLRKDAQSQELSQRQHKNKDGSRIAGITMKEKLPEIITMAIENAREGEWDNIITGNRGEKFARTWNSKTKRIGRWTLSTSDDGFVKSVAISQCGNFGFVGSSNGSINVYNLQSGLKRKIYKLHNKAVTGLGIDGMNRKMVSCGLDGIVGFYDFNSNSLLGKLKLGCPITHMVYHRSSDLFAVALDDFSIFIIDSLTHKVVRQLWGHSNRITAFDFSPDGRWVVSASLDSTIRTWDLPTGSCIDGVKLDSVATSLKFSPTGEYLATSHVFGNGISIWTNRAQFKAISTRIIDEEEFHKLLLPNASQEGGVSMLDGAFEEDESEEDLTFGKYDSVEQISDDLVTLSLGPRNKMGTLLNLDVIKKRSKPKEPPKKAEGIPFFLQLQGEKVGDDASGREGVEYKDPAAILAQQELERRNLDAQEQLRKFKPTGNIGFESKFTKKLRESAESQDYEIILKMLVAMPPSAIDLEIRSLNAFEPFDEIAWFIDALAHGLRTNKNFELYEVFMSLLIKIHGDVINANNKDDMIANALENWNKAHIQVERLDDLVKFCSGVINFVTTG
ncbi:rRNA-processing protein UTP21 Ecym_3243 [Eremothecium cymbalariae DBVPG|uniref:Uncharacterized protein n=1 Tax=Eremothecium cymbalariae (strain CBS 270.75 / DBVPG 7215 / KCTC 17166 / NRRL Y-17582) TaxID=931890 RepID=G8JRG7_ERECY|nr:Hypothetical protein Ecym_3243 [Eremothecium cymbalariae DBVPG\